MLFRPLALGGAHALMAAGLLSLLPLIFAVASSTADPSANSGPIPIVVTIPVLKDLVEHVGGGHVRVQSLMSGLESEHTYSPKPSDLVAINKARLMVEIG